MTDLILIVTGLVTLAVLLVLSRPVGRCWRCQGRRMIRRHAGRPRPCRVCRGRGIAVTPGASFVHGFFWSVFGDRILGQRRADAAERTTVRKESA